MTHSIHLTNDTEEQENNFSHYTHTVSCKLLVSLEYKNTFSSQIGDEYKVQTGSCCKKTFLTMGSFTTRKAKSNFPRTIRVHVL